MAKADILFESDGHLVVRYADLVRGEGIQANQFAIRHGDHGALIDPGGDLTFTPLTIELSRHLNLQRLDYILASHQDPDIIASLPRCRAGCCIPAAKWRCHGCGPGSCPIWRPPS
tara:strand:+ start:135 stop:479 length:345 start_codon:yes stop_codon:yes gene_type:complete